MQGRLKEHHIADVFRFPALDGKTLNIPPVWDDFPGAYGCLRSHLEVVETARQQARHSVLIFEDDAVLDPNFNARFEKCVEQLPGDWDMLFFGGIHGEGSIKVTENITRVTDTLSTYAYALKHTIYNRFIELNRQALTVLDENTRALQKEFNCYCFMPHLAWVEDDYSDVREERSDPWWLSESLVLWGNEIDRVLENTAAIISYSCNSDAALRNLGFLASYFSWQLPTVSLLVVEQGEKPSLSSGMLPDGCRVHFLKDGNGGNRSRAFNLGFEMLESGKDYFVFLDSDVFLTREDIRGNLLKCRDYDFATSFSGIYELNEEDTQRVLGNDFRWDYERNYRRQPKVEICHSACIFAGKGLSLIGGWDETDDQMTTLTSQKVHQRLMKFYSPNIGRRLFVAESLR